MGLHISVFRNPLGDCTNNGVSGKYESLCIVNVSGPFEPRADHPAVMLVEGNMPGTCKIVPAVKEMTGMGERWVAEKRWTMMGGNYGATSDSRFADAVRAITGHVAYGAVPIHDRIEE